MTTNQSRRTVLKAFGIAGTAALAGESATESVVANERRASVRILHASPDAPAVDVFVDGNAVLEGVEFGSISNYLELDPGEHSFELAPAGQGRGAAVLQASASVNAATFYTVAAIGTLDQIDVAVFENDTTRLRAGHFVPDAPAVDIALANGPVLFEGVEFGDVTDYLSLSPGPDYNIAVRASESGETVTTFEGADLEPSTTYSAFALGTVSGEDDAPLSLHLVTD